MQPLFPVSFLSSAAQDIPTANLVAWYKSSALPVVDPIPLWPDSTANANDATSSAPEEPVYEVNEINGHPSARFNWGQSIEKQHLNVADSASLDSGHVTVFAAGNIHGRGQIYGARTQVWAIKNSSSALSDPAWVLYVPDSAVPLRAVAFGGNTGAGFLAATSAILAVDDTNYVFAGRYDGAEFTAWLDGVEVATQADVGSITPTTGIMQIGGYDASFGVEEYSNSALLELAVYDIAQNDAQMLAISNILRSKYGF